MADESYKRLSCGGCGTGFVPTGPRRTYCSEGCASAINSARLNRSRAEWRAIIREHSASRFQCEHCGKDSFRKRGGKAIRLGYKNRFCSRVCRSAHQALQPKAYTGPIQCAYFARHCKSCGVAFGTRNVNRNDCNLCEAQTIRRATRDAAIALHRAAGKVSFCCGCGIKFCLLYGQSLKVCPDCSHTKKREDKRTWRTARKAKERAVRTESVRPGKVFDRAGWRCYLCGCATPRELRGTYEPNAPELDHVVPLSRGGEHSYANTDCCCRACNLDKSDQTLEELLA